MAEASIGQSIGGLSATSSKDVELKYIMDAISQLDDTQRRGLVDMLAEKKLPGLEAPHSLPPGSIQASHAKAAEILGLRESQGFEIPMIRSGSAKRGAPLKIGNTVDTEHKGRGQVTILDVAAAADIDQENQQLSARQNQA